jgi:hypothetical protein
LSCSSAPHSIVSVMGDSCACKPGFAQAGSDSPACSLSCTMIPGSKAAADAASCECRPGYALIADNKGILLACIPPLSPQSGAVDDYATVMSGFYVSVPVLANDLAVGSRISAVSNCSSGGVAAVVPAGSAGNSGAAAVFSYVSKPGECSSLG